MDYVRVSIADIIHFTDDNTSEGIPCKIETSGFSSLLLDHSGSVVFSANNTPHVFFQDTKGEGASITIRPLVVMKQTILDLIDLFNLKKEEGETIHVDVEDALGRFLELECLGGYPRPIDGDWQFSGERIFGVVVNLVVQAQVEAPPEPIGE